VRVRSVLQVLSKALLLLTVALVSALVTMRIAVHGREVEVPDLRGKTPAESRRIAESAGLAAQVERQFYSSSIPEGKVLSQTPPPGALVRRGWEVRLAASLGPQRVSIPQVVGQSQRAASIVLQQRGLDTSVAEANLPNVTANQVLAQSPQANSSEVVAPKVSLLVAGELPPEAYVMPSFVGRPLGSVALAIKDAGFTLGKITVASVPPPGAGDLVGSDNAGPSGPVANSGATGPAVAGTAQTAPGVPSAAAIVVSQQPAPGQKIVAGGEVRLQVR
jgi:eukaryotic-like serine/threonine-protein kinase